MKKFLRKKNNGFTRTPKFGGTPKGGGFTLVETLVAISIFTIAILGLMTVLSSGITSTTYAKNKIVASYLAQEGLEYVRNVRDNYVLYNLTSSQTGWNNFSAFSCTSSAPCGYNSNPATYPGYLCSSPGQTCELYLNNGSYDANASVGVDSGFMRKLLVVPVNANELKISSIVSWTQGSVTLSEDLFNWIE